MNLKQALELIPADNLYYSNIEKGWRFFSDEEFEKIIQRLAEEGLETDDMMIFLGRAQEARRLNILLNRFLNDDITFSIDDNGETVWATK